MAMGKKVLERVISDPEARELLGRIGESIELEDSIRADMKTFVLSCIYGESAGSTCGQARASNWQQMKKKSTIRLPPDDDPLNLHVERTNYTYYCQLHYSLFDHSSTIGHGWELVNGKCRPVRYSRSPLPQQLTLPDFSEESETNSEMSKSGNLTDSEKYKSHD